MGKSTFQFVVNGILKKQQIIDSVTTKILLLQQSSRYLPTFFLFSSVMQLVKLGFAIKNE